MLSSNSSETCIDASFFCEENDKQVFIIKEYSDFINLGKKYTLVHKNKTHEIVIYDKNNYKSTDRINFNQILTHQHKYDLVIYDKMDIKTSKINMSTK